MKQCTHVEQRNLFNRRTTTHGLRSFSYLGAKLWNDLVNSDPAISYFDFNELVSFLKCWDGPNFTDSFTYV